MVALMTACCITRVRPHAARTEREEIAANAPRDLPQRVLRIEALRKPRCDAAQLIASIGQKALRGKRSGTEMPSVIVEESALQWWSTRPTPVELVRYSPTIPRRTCSTRPPYQALPIATGPPRSVVLSMVFAPPNHSSD